MEQKKEIEQKEQKEVAEILCLMHLIEEKHTAYGAFQKYGQKFYRYHSPNDAFKKYKQRFNRRHPMMTKNVLYLKGEGLKRNQNACSYHRKGHQKCPMDCPKRKNKITK